MPDDEDGDQKRKKRGDALRGRLGGPSKSAETAEEEETTERPEASKTTEMSLPDMASESVETEENEETADSESSSKSEETSEMSSTTETVEREETPENEETIRERKNVNMYLPETDVQEMQIRFDELNARHRRVHGRAMEKNRDYYPAIIRAALNDTTLEEELELEE